MSKPNRCEPFSDYGKSEGIRENDEIQPLPGSEVPLPTFSIFTLSPSACTLLPVISTLRLQSFRCVESLGLELDGGASVFVGENAQGKTSLLEAICVLVRLHSPRTHRMGQLVRMGEDRFGVAGDCWGVTRRVTYGKEGLDTRIEGEPCPSQSAYLEGGGLLVWMGNEDLELVRGPGEVRRRYLDFVASQMTPGYRRDLSRYRRALKARNLLLKERQPDEAQIAAYTAILVEHGEAMQSARATLVDGLAIPVAKAHRRVSGQREEVTISYQPSGEVGNLAAAFEQAHEREWRQRQTVVGPHRDDLLLNINGLKASDFGSEGQQRTLALALKLGQGSLLESLGTRAPIFLIDDIFGELDPARRNALMAELPKGAQKLITTTSVAWLEEAELQPRIYRMAGGVVEG
jgi:DNA replication and repair protein RecF